MKKILIATSLILAALSSPLAMARAPHGLGISSWVNWNAAQVTRTDCPELRSVPLILRWDKLEPQPAKYEFDKYLGEPLRAAVEDDLDVFLHGYHVSSNRERLQNFRLLEVEARKRGKPVITRGEMDAELYVMGWSNRNVPQALYWSGLFATHCRLDVWNIPHKALKDKANLPAFIFFNRYAGYTDPAKAPAAFCALRDGLDASDFDRFPAAEFGGKEGKKRDVARYVRIAKAFAKRGARMVDPQKAVGGGMINRKRNGSNDVGWRILPGNYSRFLTQRDPGSGDVGFWNIDDSIYGRFARGFDCRSGKTQMRFELDEAFQADTIAVNVTYLDRGRGVWSISVVGSPQKELFHNSDSGQWKTVRITMPRIRLQGAQLLLNYENGDNTVFHMIEIIGR